MLTRTTHDSLQATWIRNSILHAVRQTTRINVRAVPGNFVYQHPTIDALARYLSGLVREDTTAGTQSKMDAMHAMVEKYVKDFPNHTSKTGAPAQETVLVTGTTGGLGAALLAALVEDPEVKKVYAVNRRSDVPLAERQRDILNGRGYDADRILQSEKVTLIETNPDEDKLGLQPAMYDEVSIIF